MKITTDADLVPGRTLGSTAVFYVKNRAHGMNILRVTCDRSDPTRRIWISHPNGTDPLRTTGEFTVSDNASELIEDASGAPVGVVSGVQGVDLDSVAAYVGPHLIDLLAVLMTIHLEV